MIIHLLRFSLNNECKTLVRKISGKGQAFCGLRDKTITHGWVISRLRGAPLVFIVGTSVATYIFKESPPLL